MDKVELYDPTFETASKIFDVRQPRYGHASTTSESGVTLITGGRTEGWNGVPITSANFMEDMQEMEAPDLPQRRSAHGSAFLGGTYFVLGGEDSKMVHDKDIRPVSADFALRHGSASWMDIHPMTTSVYCAGTVALRNQILVIGGVCHWIENKVQAYHPGIDKWTEMKPFPEHIKNIAGAFSGGKLYVFGGSLFFRSVGPTNRVWSMDPRTGKWEAETDMEKRRDGHCAVAFQGNILALGGRDRDGSWSFMGNTVERFDPRNKKWSAVRDLELDAIYSTAFICDA